ncbi:unnamed protein product [Sympodiomycopsis kandeliae]
MLVIVRYRRQTLRQGSLSESTLQVRSSQIGMASRPIHVVVVGCGVIGLSSAVSLLDSPIPAQVTIISSHLPSATGKHPSEYASTWAGAHHVTAGADEREYKWDETTFHMMKRLKQANPKSHGLVWVRQSEWFTRRPENELEIRAEQDLMRLYPGCQERVDCGHDYFRVHRDLPVIKGYHFDTLDFNVPVYLLELYQRFLQLGGRVIQQKVASIEEAIQLARSRYGGEVDSLVLSPGLGIRSFTHDFTEQERSRTYVVRGQTVLVRAPWLRLPSAAEPHWPALSRTNENFQRSLYVIPRGQGEFILGGTRIEDDEDSSPRDETTTEIVQRALKVCPRLARSSLIPGRPDVKDVDIVGVNVGFRPARRGGPVLEQMKCEGDTKVIMAYGFGSYGYQNSWGVAFDVRREVYTAVKVEGVKKGYTLMSLEQPAHSQGVEHLWADKRARL